MWAFGCSDHDDSEGCCTTPEAVAEVSKVLVGVEGRDGRTAGETEVAGW